MDKRYKYGRCRLPELFSAAGITQQELADRLGYSRAEVSDWVSGRKKMSFTTGITVAKVLRCSPEDLYEWIPEGVSEPRVRQRKGSL